MDEKLTDDELMWCEWYDRTRPQVPFSEKPFLAGVKAELDRIRPLLERCLVACEASDSGPWPPGETPTSLRLAVVAALRLELGLREGG